MPSNISDRLISIFSRQTSRGHRTSNGDSPHNKLTDEKKQELRAYALKRPLRELDILRRAASKLNQGWVAQEIAVDADGNPVEPDDSRACKWCMSGALQAAAYEIGAASTHATQHRIERTAREVLAAAGVPGFKKTDPVITLASLNDNLIHSKEEALSIFEKAIAAKEQECREKGLL